MTETNPPNASPQFNSRRRSGHHRKPGTLVLWHFGVLALPPAAIVGLSLTILDFVSPSVGILPILHKTAYAVIGLCAISLLLILYDVRPGSKRLRRRNVWLAVALAVITIPMLFYADRRAQQREGPYVPVAAPDIGSSGP